VFFFIHSDITATPYNAAVSTLKVVLPKVTGFAPVSRRSFFSSSVQSPSGPTI